MPSLFVDHLTVMDFAFADMARGIVGESWLVSVELHGDLNDEGMIFDFGHVKKELKRVIDAHFDHQLLVPENAVTVEQLDADNISVCWQSTGGNHYRHITPNEAVAIIPLPKIEPASFAKYLEGYLLNELPSNVTGLSVHLEPEHIDAPYFHYAHGLKKHDGNCQRIAHGHRSRFEVLVDGVRQTAIEEQWCAKWKDIYLATREDLSATIDKEGTTYHRFVYTAAQGQFTLELPATDCYLVDTDTTIELITQHVANCLHADNPDTRYTVRVFEGVKKGAVARV